MSFLRRFSSHVSNRKERLLDVNKLNALLNFATEMIPDSPSSTPNSAKRVGLKDNLHSVATVTTAGSVALSRHVSVYDSCVARRLKRSGFRVSAKTNLDEFAMGDATTTGLAGPAVNPWGHGEIWGGNEPPLIAGGSSGGSGVAAALGLCEVALGSDTGGSNQIPAAMCGVFGLKPTYGRVSRQGLIPLVNSLDCVSFMARRLEDIVTAFNAVTQNEETDDSTLLPPSRPLSLEPSSFSPSRLRIGIPREFFPRDLVSRDVIQSAVTRLQNQGGAQIVDISLPQSLRWSPACYLVLCCCEVASNMAKFDGINFGTRLAGDDISVTRSTVFKEAVKSRIVAGNYFLLEPNFPRFFEQALRLRSLVKAEFDAVLTGQCDVILTPVTPRKTPTLRDWLTDMKEGGHSLSAQTGLDVFTQPVNLAGLPSLVVPLWGGESTPVSPGTPVTPVSPGTPVSPVSPVSPGAPVSPGTPPHALQLIGAKDSEQMLCILGKWLSEGRSEEEQQHYVALDHALQTKFGL